jgi:hypothetical protein
VELSRDEARASALAATANMLGVASGRCSPDVRGRPEITEWWSRGESNPRPQAIAGQFYMRSCLI